MVSWHVPDSFILFGMVVGVAIVPMVVLGTLFLIVKDLFL
jgi:hypothetical protein